MITDTYKTIETETITDQINRILTKAGIDYTAKIQVRPDGLKTTKHAVI